MFFCRMVTRRMKEGRVQMKPKTVMLDMMFTVFEPVDSNRWLLYKQVLKALFNIDAEEDTVQRVYKTERKAKESAESRPEGRLPNGYYRNHWSEINAALLKGLGHSD